MQKGPHLEFACPGCDSPVTFTVTELAEKEYVCPCINCQKRYVFNDEVLMRQLKKFTNLCTAIHQSEEILGMASIGIKVNEKEVNIPFKLLLTRLSSQLELMLGDMPLTILFRIEPTELKELRR